MAYTVLLILLMGAAGCAATPWYWQDLGSPPRASAEADLADCRSYAATQYVPGIPAGDPYLKNHPQAPAFDQEAPDIEPGTGTWHPDREPFPYTNRSQETKQGVVVPYTGYPGYLDYHPEYLDALVDKCMTDRGWVFRPSNGSSPK
jgi:hypothetical protein